MQTLFLDGESLTIHDVAAVAYASEEGRKVRVELSEAAWRKVARAERAVRSILERGEVVYGVITGFGAFRDRSASADTILSSGNVEDHFSMGGPTAARQTRRTADSGERILALELLAAARGSTFAARPWGLTHPHGRGTGPAYRLICKAVPFLEQDAVMYPYIEAVRRLVASGQLAGVVQTAQGDGPETKGRRPVRSGRCEGRGRQQ
jgi:histidine ammonia-lyase